MGIFIVFSIFTGTTVPLNNPAAAGRQGNPQHRDAPAKIKPDVSISDWSVGDATRSVSGNFVSCLVRVKLFNHANAAGHYVTTLEGLDDGGYPVWKQRLDIETRIQPLGTIQDAEELTFYAHEWDRIAKWNLVVEPRGY